MGECIVIFMAIKVQQTSDSWPTVPDVGTLLYGLHTAFGATSCAALTAILFQAGIIKRHEKHVRCLSRAWHIIGAS